MREGAADGDIAKHVEPFPNFWKAIKKRVAREIEATRLHSHLCAHSSAS